MSSFFFSRIKLSNNVPLNDTRRIAQRLSITIEVTLAVCLHNKLRKKNHDVRKEIIETIFMTINHKRDSKETKRGKKQRDFVYLTIA